MFESIKSKLVAVIPTTTDVKVVAAVATGVAAFITVNAIATAKLNDLGESILDLF